MWMNANSARYMSPAISRDPHADIPPAQSKGRRSAPLRRPAGDKMIWGMACLFTQ